MTLMNDKYRQAIEESQRLVKSILDKSSIACNSEEESIIQEYATHTTKRKEVNLTTAWLKLWFRYNSRYLYTAASAAVVLIITSLFIFMPKNNNNSNKVLAFQEEIKPASGVVSLKLASGEIVSIDSISSTGARLLGVDLDNSKHEISYTGESSNNFNISNKFIDESNKTSAALSDIVELSEIEMVAFNELIIPKGRSYSLVLSDGTRVWLNSESSIRYPVSFGKGERRVKISGEAFFYVKHDAGRVFVAETENYNIKVLGTKFNISSYLDEDVAAATLVSGSISISSGNISHQEEAVVSPGEQFRYNKSNKTIEITKVDTELYTSWVDNNLRIDQMSLEDIFKILCRRYDIDVFFIDEQAKHQKFSGKIPLNDKLNIILDQIAKVSKVEFQIEKRIINIRYKD